MLGSMTERGPLRVAAAAVLLVVLAPLAGCGTASAPSPPAGVDELVVPTPSPDPSDFVATVDNPWFPLEPGRTWRYDVAGPTGNHALLVSVTPGPTVAGVPTTARVSQESGRQVVDWYAQDDQGNVWWFGRAGQWRAGAAGAEAGLAMPATPRVGDGYWLGYATDVVEETATVLAVDDEQLLVEETSALEPGVVDRLTYVHGTGLVQQDRTAGGYRVVRLVP